MRVLSSGFSAILALALAGTANAQFSTQNPIAGSAQKGQATPVTTARTPALPPGAVALLMGSDTCNVPFAIAGDGPHAFDNSAATTGTEGQAEPLCLSYGSTAINNDVWFSWTATVTGTTSITTCGMTTVDTKIAVYDGSGCPTGAAIGCNDDACAFQTTALFAAVAGQTYTIQLGTFPGAPGGVGDFMFSTVPTPTCYTLDFGTSNNAVGLTAGGDMIIMNGFTAGGGADVITQIEATFGTAAFPGGYTTPVPMVVAIWNDPTNDFDPTDAVLLYSGPVPAAGAANIDTDVFAVYPVPNVPVTGVFFIGLMFNSHAASQFPASLDQSVPGGGQVWVAGGAAGTGDLANLLNNGLPPTNLDTIVGLAGRWMLRAVGPNCNAGAGVGTGYCFGDGTGIVPCPCGNTGTAGRGCANSTASGGALLEGSGSASIGAGNLILQGSGSQPGQPGLYFQGNNAINGGNGIQNGDGLRCAGGNIRRLEVRTAGNNASANPGASETTINIAVSGAVLPGDTKRYQWWYRNPAVGAPCGTGFNFSNGLEVVWVP